MVCEIDFDGSRKWRNLEGYLHRDDGPAIEKYDGGKCWYVNNELHRVDGPAVELINEEKYWYIEGMLYNKEEFDKVVSKI